ncbi:serine/threonine-protein kinase [Kitasatospora purpeofusca]|uniref:Serine/threonine protein kinase n=1 Tax=Kitasatospora purpeofusca TaxID=67352 RepID=A0ABZ1U7D0_9ACTN|nr:serine/threonine-protein kinase [Kitasatospora purpeofusca]
MEPLDSDVDPLVIGPFELLAVLGEGGMGRAYLARRLPLDNLGPELEAGYYLAEGDEDRENTLSVVKVISPKYLQSTQQDEDEKRARFAREISAVRAVVSDRVPSLLAADPEAAQPWLAIDYVHGPDLSTMIKKNDVFSVGPYAALGLALVEALRAIHGAKLLHRDLKPGNVVLGPTGPVVLDFGLAVLVDRRTSQAVTKTGLGFGSAGYMPLEQATDLKRVKEPADVYALGATLFFAATGRPPFPLGPMLVSPVWDDVDKTFIPLLAKILVPIPEQRPSLDGVEQGLLELLVQHGLSSEDADAQLREVVERAGLAPELPPSAIESAANAEVQAAAQQAVDAGAAPDAPWVGGDDLFAQLFASDELEVVGPEPMQEPGDGYSPTLIDPANVVTVPLTPADAPSGRTTMILPIEPPQAGAVAQAPSRVAPAAALRVAKYLREAYARSGTL